MQENHLESSISCVIFNDLSLHNVFQNSLELQQDPIMVMDLEMVASCGTSFYQLVIASIMLGIGHSFSDDCNNGGKSSLLLLN